MPSSFRRSLPITGVAVLMTGALAVAQTPATPAPRVRPETRHAAALLDELIARSPTGRALVDAVQASDLVVYVRHRTFTTTTLDGRIGFVRSDVPTRVVIVELAWLRSWTDQLVTLAHELQHAAEIAAAPEVVGAPTLYRYFGRIGVRTGRELDSDTFETEQARRTSAQVRQELCHERP